MIKLLRFAFACVLVGAPLLFAAEPPAPATAPVAAGRESFQKAPAHPADLSHDRNLYVVGYAHLDTQWRWSYPQVTREFIANTLRDNFALLDKFPNYIFNFSGSRRYEMMAEYYPQEFARMKQYIAAGRWFPAGSSVDESDSNVPSAESLLRHVLYGNHYFRHNFGVASDEFMLPDCFGFPYSLPTILAHAGIKGFSTQKLTWGSAVGIPFKVGTWEGPDGHSVVAALDPGAYTGQVREDLSRNESWLKRIEDTGTQSGAYVDYHYYGTGDRGGAPAADSVAWIERSIASQGPIRVISSRADQMFNDLSSAQMAKLPHYKGELLLTQHSAGSITSQAYMKRWNRKNELLADAAERASVAALWLGAAPYPSQKLYKAWDLVLGSQMHDMLPGTSLPRAYQFCWNDELLAANQFSAVLQGAVGAVAASLDTRAQGVPLVVYNPLSIARDDVVEATVVFPGAAPDQLSVVAPDGRVLPAQVLGREGARVTIAFVAHLPPVGFATFDVCRGSAAASNPNETLRISRGGLENARYRVTVAANGDVVSILDKAANRELLSAPARLAFQTEKPEQHPAWNMDWADQQKPPRGYVDGPARVTVVESGPVRVALEVEREAEGSRFIQTIRLAAGAAGDRVEFSTRIDWQSMSAALKATLPLTVSNPLATYDSQVGTLQRANNDPKKYEVPQHQWFDLTAVDQSYGIAVLNDCKYGSDKPDDHTVRLTLVYTPGVRTRFQDQAYQDFGRHEMLYAVASHPGDWRQGEVPWAASRLNQPLLAFQTAAHRGPLGRSLSLFNLSTGQVMLEAVKKAEDSDELIVRFQELTGHPAASVRLAAPAGIAAAREVDGQERQLGEAKVERGALTFDVGAYGLRTFAIRLGASAAHGVAPTSQPVALAYDEDVVSTNSHRADGQFDAQGRSYPAEQLPRRLASEGVEFELGATADGEKNALAARGQAIALPAGGFDHLYLLAASDGDATGRFAIDGRPVDLAIQDWSGFIGQWDTRLWHGAEPEVTYVWFNQLAGLTPGFVKPAAVAWYASHRHQPADDDHYQYSYLFKYALPLPAGARTLTLPDNPRIRIFALTVARNAGDDVVAATPLFDELKNHQPDAPQLPPAPDGTAPDTLVLTIPRPLYWHEGGLHYTLDGSTPTLHSPVYVRPMYLNHAATVTACEFDPAGRASPVARTTYRVQDRTPPRVSGGVALASEPVMRVTFSEPVEPKRAADPATYQLPGDVRVEVVELAPDALSAILRLSAPLPCPTQLSVHGLRDASPAGNALAEQTLAVSLESPIFSAAADAAKDYAISAPGLPVKADQSWTMNVFVRTDHPVDNRTLIAGFGRLQPRNPREKNAPVGRYFGSFGNGVHVWVRGLYELESTTPLITDGTWQMLTATYDGTKMRLLINGHAVSESDLPLADDDAVVQLEPTDPWDDERKFQGEVRRFQVWDHVLPPAAVELLKATQPKS